MKAAPVIRALAAHSGVRQTLVHTGQHYDANMSDIFFEQLGMPEPDVNLEVGSASHAQQTAQIISKLEPVVIERRPDIVLVYGDVNSTVAAALVCAKLLVRVAHVEAGLRSFDRTMPEEINRIVTDRLSDLLFTPSTDGDENLVREGVDRSRIHYVGNVMIDTLVRMLPLAQQRIPAGLPERYALVTLHRPANVDDSEWLSNMLRTLAEIGDEVSVVFPVHPRTRQRLTDAKLDIVRGEKLRFLEPLPYLDFLALQTRATLVITDSGGIQEETTFLGVPCLTVRENTERPVTISSGTNVLVGRDPERIRMEVNKVLAGKWRKGSIPDLWDGHAAERIADVLRNAG
jgi:UDP-N-acetylglucosamine 2-epimerase (non-hydrolysing)